MEAKERIKESALKLFSERGYRGTSVREIAEMAGVTKPTIYYHFKDKENLFETILKGELSELIKSVEGKISLAQTLEGKFLGFAQGYLEYFKSRQEVVKVILGELLGFVEGKKVIAHDYLRLIIEKAEEIFSEARGNLSEVEAESLALSWVGYLNMVILNSLMLKKDWSVEEVMGTLKTVLHFLIQHHFI
jgi:AcrR family transcriptional regulator